MSMVRGKNSKPERWVRSLVFAAGYRYRLHDTKLPGKPDMVFPGRRKVIFVHGCFWHRHVGCELARMPKSRVDFWTNKLEGNRARDIRNYAALLALGWSILVVWECELRDHELVARRIDAFLSDQNDMNSCSET